MLRIPTRLKTPIELIPMAMRAFGPDQVQGWIDLYAQSLEDHLRRWPDDTLVGNNLAWFYANVDQRLERARQLSRHVAELLPEDGVYLDTLAEVEFRLGHVEEAIAIAARCRQLDPLEPHYRSQIHRFLKQGERGGR